MEQWKDVVGFEGIYQVSDKGSVKRIGMYRNQRKSWPSTGKLLRPANNSKDVNSYKFVNLSSNNKTKMSYVHRLVAIAFLPNPENLPSVNHIDGDRANNCVDNLEWASYADNNVHSIKILGRVTKNKSDSKVVLQFDLNRNLIKEFPSFREAERQTGITGIDKVCAGVQFRKSAGGFIWEYRDKNQ